MFRLTRVLNKRWISFFVLYFIVWYPVSITLASAYQIVGQAVLLYASALFTVIYWFFISYLYFRKAQNDWISRFLAGSCWIALMILFVTVLSEPVLGIPWRNVLSVYTFFGIAVNLAAILAGGMFAPHVGVETLLARSRAALRPSLDRLPPEQDSVLPQ